MQQRRLAVLVDGDNISARHSADVLSHAADLGRVDIARVYGAFTSPSDWPNTPGFRTIFAGAGKNAADLLLSIDAMELALEHDVQIFVIAASDRDYIHLAQRLRERGLHVLGIGEPKAPQAFRVACSAFLTLKTGNGQSKENAKGNFSDFDLRIRNMIAQHGTKGQGMRICELAPKMHSAHGTRISTYPEKTWRAYLCGRPTLYEVDPRGPEAMVRFLTDAFQTP